MIMHTVFFRLKHAAGSEQEAAFLDKASSLSQLPDVLDFKVLQQVGKKNSFTHGLSMAFISDETYQAYNNHADHLHFVNTYWIPQVEEFMEIDYLEIKV